MGLKWLPMLPETDMNPDLFSGFLSAIQDFTIELSKNELKMFQAGIPNIIYIVKQIILSILSRK